jgi:hypothetical protein
MTPQALMHVCDFALGACEEGTAATHFCAQCSECMCADCAVAHARGRATRFHHASVTPIVNSTPRGGGDDGGGAREGARDVSVRRNKMQRQLIAHGVEPPAPGGSEPPVALYDMLPAGETVVTLYSVTAAEAKVLSPSSPYICIVYCV